MNLPKFWFYAQDYNGRAIAFNIGPLTLYYSYSTIIGFEYKGKEVICENVWGRTTGKHLNILELDKKKRYSYEDFHNYLNSALKEFLGEANETD